MDKTKLKEFVTAAEGRRLGVYRDSRGIATIGVGVNLEEPRNQQRLEVLGRVAGNVVAGREELTDKEVDWLLDGDLELAIADARTLFPLFDELDEVRQLVLVDMAFDLGRQRLASFKRMRAALLERDFERAAEEMRDSAWFKQFRARGERNVAALRTGGLDGGSSARAGHDARVEPRVH